MNSLISTTVCTIITAFCVTSALAATGEELFKQHCAVCHPAGGNIIKPTDTLHKKDLAKDGIKDWKGIVKTMRAPQPGMTKFDKKTLPDKDARKIADYVLKTFQ